MKKIYFSSWACIFLFLGYSGIAQNACPGPNPPAVRNFSFFINEQQVCVVFVEAMQPNALVTLFGPGLSLIPTPSGNSVITDGAGFAAYSFICTSSPVRIATCNASGCCVALVPAAIVLPVRLTKFNIRLINENTASLDWTSAAEFNSRNYIVERSRDGKNFESIGTINAAGNSSRTINYQYNDKLAVSGAYFYRLNQIDIDGKSEYSKVVYINSGKTIGTSLRVFPNPFQSDVQLVGITTGDLNSKNVRLFNTTGQQINYQISGANAITIDDTNPKGVYILKVKEQAYKLIKQ